MRILKLRFKNLNSLVGEWTIDLTHPAFTSDGIFAITGPTGAGKTTLLDAICLALYGRTPRLSKVTKSANEIMSRQTGECFAEVTFETQAGRFRCHWSQHRARNKAGGELQLPKHEIADAVSGHIFESKLSSVAKQIEAVTGMDFQRFTRSMLLAQGDFAAFLQAAPDERAPILEQITGTEIYSQISMRVHERHVLERRNLSELAAELAGMRLLTLEEAQHLSESLEQKKQQDVKIQKELDLKNEAIHWVEEINRLERELQALDQTKSALKIRLETFAPEQERLRLALLALELSADHAALVALRTAQGRDQGNWANYQTALPGSAETATQAREAMQAAEIQVIAKKAEQQTALPMLRNVRELDLKITEKEAPIAAAQDFATQLAAAVESLEAKQREDSEQLIAQSESLAQVQALLTASPLDGKLVEQLEALQGRYASLTVQALQLQAKHEAITQTEAKQKEALLVWESTTSGLENEKRTLTATKTVLEKRQADMLQLLEGQEAAGWRKKQLELVGQRDRIGETLKALEALLAAQSASSQLDTRQELLGQEISRQTSQLRVHNDRREALEREVELLETQLLLLKKIADLKAERHALQDGAPCPLCGATEHPFAKGNTPPPKAEQQRLTTAKAELAALREVISHLQIDMARKEQDFKQMTQERGIQTEKEKEARQIITEHCALLRVAPQAQTDPAELGTRLQELEAETLSQLAHASDILDMAETWDKEISTLRNAQDTARKTVEESEHKAQAAAYSRQTTEQLLQRLTVEELELRAQQDQALAMLQKQLAVFGLAPSPLTVLEAVFAQLELRRDQWLARNEQKTRLEQKIAGLQIETQYQADQLLSMHKDLEKQQRRLAELRREQRELFTARKELFGDKQLDAEEQRLQQAIEAAESAFGAARKKAEASNQELHRLEAQIGELKKAIEERELQVQAAASAFMARLKVCGFLSEDAYTRACITEAERTRLRVQEQQLSDEYKELAAREREKTELLETERLKDLTREALPVLQEAAGLLESSKRELQQQIGGIQQQLREDALKKEQQLGRVQAIEAQRLECARWDRLHELIGSADGKKYRIFAQGLTFEIMVGHANRQLQKMNDRYLLVRDTAQALELNVVDSYQAGETRSTKNLSGGESFIISLALALGLSQMASKNVRVDSLFLDEGFGTLDEEALDTALETLSGLQHEGKLIGVISHVPALKERISTQILVSPQTGGRSRISGPGCGQNASA